MQFYAKIKIKATWLYGLLQQHQRTSLPIILKLCNTIIGNYKTAKINLKCSTWLMIITKQREICELIMLQLKAK